VHARLALLLPQQSGRDRAVESLDVDCVGIRVFLPNRWVFEVARRLALLLATTSVTLPARSRN
jgi:hypothetical protein